MHRKAVRVQKYFTKLVPVFARPSFMEVRSNEDNYMMSTSSAHQSHCSKSTTIDADMTMTMTEKLQAVRDELTNLLAPTLRIATSMY